jgi:hypothetical protein
VGKLLHVNLLSDKITPPAAKCFPPWTSRPGAALHAGVRQLEHHHLLMNESTVAQWDDRRKVRYVAFMVLKDLISSTYVDESRMTGSEWVWLGGSNLRQGRLAWARWVAAGFWVDVEQLHVQGFSGAWGVRQSAWIDEGGSAIWKTSMLDPLSHCGAEGVGSGHE